MELAWPGDLPRPLPQHWRAPQLPQSQPQALGSLACIICAICCRGQPHCLLLPGMPALLPPCHLLCALRGLADTSEN